MAYSRTGRWRRLSTPENAVAERYELVRDRASGHGYVEIPTIEPPDRQPSAAENSCRHFKMIVGNCGPMLSLKMLAIMK